MKILFLTRKTWYLDIMGNYIRELLNIDLKKDSKKTIKLKIRSANPLYPGPYIDVGGVKKTVRLINGKHKVVDKKFLESFKYGKL